MQALVMQGHGDLDRLEVAEMPDPEISRASDVRVALKAAALNHLDLWTLHGLPGLELDFPHVLGGDGAGVVEAVGDDVTHVAPGDRVMFNPGISCYACAWCLKGEHSLCESYRLLGEHLPGTLAERIVLPGHNVVRIPDRPDGDVTFGEAAAYSLVTLTAWRMLVTRARIRPGEAVLIWGIGGGVSSTAVQIARLQGARVIATSSSDAKLEQARSWGADITVNHATQDVAKAVRQALGRRGVDVVVDNVGEATWDTSLRLLDRGGRLVTCGATTGPDVTVDVRRLFWFQWEILGSTMGSHAEYQEIVRLLGQGRLRPVVDSTFPFSRAVEAFARLEGGEQVGKIVVEI